MKQFEKKYQLWVAIDKDNNPKAPSQPYYTVEEYDTPQEAFDAALSKSTGDLAITEKFEFEIVSKREQAAPAPQEAPQQPQPGPGGRTDIVLPPEEPRGGGTVVELSE